MDEPIIDSPAAVEGQPPAGETPAMEQPAKGLHEMNRAERREFLQGTDTKAEKATPSDGKPADSSTAPAEGKTAAEIAAKKDQPASEPGAPGKDKKARNSEESRISELLEDRKRADQRAERAEREREDLRKRLDALEAKPKTDAKTPDPSTAADPSAPEWKKYREMKGAPKIGEFEDPDDWGAAMAVFVGTQIAVEQVASALKLRDEGSAKDLELHREMERVVNTAADRLEADEKAHADLIPKINPRLRDLVPMRLLPEGAPSNVDHFIKDCIVFDGDHPLQLHAYYSTDDGWNEWAAMRTMDRRGIERTIARRDLSFGASLPGSPAADPKPAAKTRSQAPPPPDKSGPKSATTADDVDQAVKAGDFAAMVSALDEREGVTTRRYGRRRG